MSSLKCDKCGVELQIGMYPFCKGTPESHGPSLMRSGNGVFPFTTTNIDGKPMTIESITQLRKVEKDFGVVFSAFNRDNWQDCAPTDSNLPRFRGNDEDVRHDYRNRYRK